MKISLVVSDLSKSGVGRWGGAVRPFLLSQALRQLGHSVEILGFNREVSAPTRSQIDGIPIAAWPARPYPPFLTSARQLLQHLDGDLIYAYKLKATSFGLALLHRRLRGRPVLLDIDDWELGLHGGENFAYRPSPRQLARDLLKANGALRNPDHPLYLQWAEGWVAQADAVTTHTQFMQARFGGVYLPNGKDVHRFDPDRYDAQASRDRYGLAGYRVLMFPGAPRPYKGIEDVLVALDQLDIPDLRLVIVGGSPYDDYDEQLRSRWGRWIVQLPPVPAEQMPEVVAAAHVVVVPQRNHPNALAQFPLKLTDGMAMAKPILATTVGDIPEILGEAGYLVPPSAPDQIAATLQAIFGEWEGALARGQQARRRCVEHYSVEVMADILARLLARWQS